MKNLTMDVKNNLAELKEALEKVDDFLRTAPKGRINIIERGDKKYYQQLVSNKKGELVRRKIKSDDYALIDRLIIKTYYENIRSKILCEISAHEKFLSHYSPSAKDLSYTRMSKCRKDVVTPLFPNYEYILKNWLAEPAITYTGYSEKLIYTTNNNERVRSKSELFIANELFSHKDVLRYHYEPCLYLEKSSVTVRPDFGIINLKTGQEYYWEHIGMLDNLEYSNDYVIKYNRYIANGYLPGKNLLLTFESSNSPLDTTTIKAIVNSIL